MACAACERRRAWMKKWVGIAKERAVAKFGAGYGQVNNGEAKAASVSSAEGSGKADQSMGTK